MADQYSGGQYLDKNPTWHIEDSPWKASQIHKMIKRNGLACRRVCEVGCGAGRVLHELSKQIVDANVSYDGYDISPQAIEMARQVESGNLRFHLSDPFGADPAPACDLLLAIDVFEHVPDYMGFLEKCRARARFKIYHIPLDVHVSSVVRGSLARSRRSVGHLHYFTAETARCALEDTGHRIVDSFYTAGAIDLMRRHVSAGRALAMLPRMLLSMVSVKLAARLLGGFSLLVLAE